MIDVTHLDHITISPDRQTVTAGAGIRFGALLTALDRQNLTWTTGICPTVGLSGFLSAGGFNMQMRKLGLAVDHVASARVVRADGCTVVASPRENPDLFWAIRGGGGGNYGIVIEWTLKTLEFPRSAMVLLKYDGQATRLDVANRFLEWAPKADVDFTSQVNVFKDHSEVMGWCLGCSAEKLQGLLNASGLLSIGAPTVYLLGGCNSVNARLFGFVVNECLPDEVIAQYAPFAMNTVQQPFVQIGSFPQFAYNQSTQQPAAPQAQPYPRFIRLSKSYFVQKRNQLRREVIRDVIARIDQAEDAAQAWGEWHAWNISASGDAAFAWREEAYAHLEFIVHGDENPAVHKTREAWLAGLESYLRPIVGYVSFLPPHPLEGRGNDVGCGVN